MCFFFFLSRQSQKSSTNWELQFSCSVLSDSLRLHGLQHARLPCPLPTPRVCSNSCPLGWWCHLTISSSVVPFSSCLQSFPASGSFQMSQFFSTGGQSTGVSASTLRTFYCSKHITFSNLFDPHKYPWDGCYYYSYITDHEGDAQRGSKTESNTHKW